MMGHKLPAARLAYRRAYAKRKRAEGTSEHPRDLHGYIATLREQETGEVVSFVRHGFKLDALREIAQWCDETEGDWRVLCLSTPSLIARDLIASRVTRVSRRGDVTTLLPEFGLLQRIGRGDLVDPSLVSGSYDPRRDR